MTPAGFLGFGFGQPDIDTGQAAVCLAGLPFDLGTTDRAGARGGPGAVRLASRMLIDGAHPNTRRRPDHTVFRDIGDFRIALGDIAASLALIEAQAARCPHLIAIGGDHTVTLPLLRALAARTGPVGLIHFDAHVDTWPESFGQKYCHSSVFFHALNERLVDPARMVQIGIRSPVDPAVWDWTLAQGVRVINAEEVHEQGPRTVAEIIRATVGTGPTYLSFDIDAIDPGQAPGTGTPEIGGLLTWQVLSILRRLDDIAFVGMDVVEVCPACDVSEITALAAATVVWEYLCRLSPTAPP